MKIIVDDTRCVGGGQCVAMDASVFDQSEDDGIVILLNASPGPEHAAAVRQAALLCPAAAIHVEE